MPAPPLVLATRNPHKLREFRRLLAASGVQIEPLPDPVKLPPEDGVTFADNALPKAQTAAAETGRAAIADDSGIEAEALEGLPGVRSARYAGEGASDQQNLEKLIEEAPAGSGLRYVCALAFVDPAAEVERMFFGDCRGRMAPAPKGSGGFGYDPVFIADATGDGRTMAELSDQEKDAISHRGNAARALAAWLARR